MLREILKIQGGKFPKKFNLQIFFNWSNALVHSAVKNAVTHWNIDVLFPLSAEEKEIFLHLPTHHMKCWSKTSLAVENLLFNLALEALWVQLTWAGCSWVSVPLHLPGLGQDAWIWNLEDHSWGQKCLGVGGTHPFGISNSQWSFGICPSLSGCSRWVLGQDTVLVAPEGCQEWLQGFLLHLGSEEGLEWAAGATEQIHLLFCRNKINRTKAVWLHRSVDRDELLHHAVLKSGEVCSGNQGIWNSGETSAFLFNGTAAGNL